MEGDEVALTPLNDCILIAPEPFKSYGEQMGFVHVVVPDKYKAGPIDPPIWGLVLFKGASCTNETIKRGSRVLVGKWAGVKLKWAQPGYGLKDYLIVKEKDVLALDGS